VNWTVFDGLKMFAIKKRLAGNEMLSKYELKVQLENTVAAIIVAYCDIVRIDEQIKAAKQNLSLYEERRKIAKMRFDIGSSSKVDFLLSQTDLNRAKTDLLQLELQLTNAKATLNNLMARPIDIDFSATDSIVISYQPNLEDLKKNSLQNNSQLLIAKQNEYNLQQQIKEAKAFYYPTIQLNGSYNFIRNQSQAGFVFLNQQNGLNGNLALNWTLFNGLKNMRNLKEKQINFLNQQINTQKTKLLIDATVFINYQNYIANQKILDFEKQNLTDAKELIFISQERFKEGKTTILETIEVQKKYEEAQAKYINALYSAKKAETELLKTNGILVDQKLY
jgi:outer membrane protein TolC